MITTTLNKIRGCYPYQDKWEKLLNSLGKTEADDELFPFSVIVESNGLDDALWCCRAEPQYAREWRLFAVWCARRVSHLLIDQQSLNALDVAERHANGLATDDELSAAWAAAWDAARGAAWDAARGAACGAALAAARGAAWDAAAWAAALAAASDAAWGAASDAAWGAEREAQQIEFLRVVGGLND